MDTADAVSLLRRLVEIESPTGSEGVVEVAEVLAEELEALGAETELLEGGHLRAELPGRGEPLLVIGHTDTVWPEGTLAQMPFRVDAERAYGPASTT
jgi:glutamate carboxypeptidase